MFGSATAAGVPLGESLVDDSAGSFMGSMAGAADNTARAVDVSTAGTRAIGAPWRAGAAWPSSMALAVPSVRDVERESTPGFVKE